MRPTLWPALACFLVVPLAWTASQTSAGQELDGAGHEAATAWPGSDEAWRDASWPGLTLVAGVVLAACAIACSWLRDRRAAVLSLAAALVIPAVHAAKVLVERARPEGALVAGFAFPSGHAAYAMTAYGIAALLVVPAAVRRGAPAWTAPLAVGLWVGLALAVGVARVAAGVHWPTDVLAGWALGGAVVGAAWWAAFRPVPSL